MAEKEITRVRWSAEDLPYGLEMDETNGQISGTPEDVGEYTVPVTVETNYGTDTKDVRINVTPEYMSSGVYIAGSSDIKSSSYLFSGGAEMNLYSFRKIDVPKPIKLVRHTDNGLGIFNENGEYYCCGPYANKHISDVYTNPLVNSIAFMNSTTPVNLYRTIKDWAGDALTPEEDEILFGVDRVIRVNGDVYSNGDPVYYQQALILWNSKLAKAIIFPTKVNNFGYGSNWLEPRMKFDFTGILPESGIEILGEPPYRKYPLTFLTNGNTTLGGVDLGYKVKKFFPKIPNNSNSDKFYTLSESGYLDNNPDNFTHGIIKDAWSYYTFATYVQTIENKFYYYNHSEKTWDFIGIADAQRVETGLKALHILTKDGKLYYHGDDALMRTTKGITYGEKIDSLTRLFPALTFKDFTLIGQNTPILVVLK